MILGLSQAPQFNPADRKIKFATEQTVTPAPNTYNQTSNGFMKSDPKFSFSKSQRSFAPHSGPPARN